MLYQSPATTATQSHQSSVPHHQFHHQPTIQFISLPNHQTSNPQIYQFPTTTTSAAATNQTTPQLINFHPQQPSHFQLGHQLIQTNTTGANGSNPQSTSSVTPTANTSTSTQSSTPTTPQQQQTAASIFNLNSILQQQQLQHQLQLQQQQQQLAALNFNPFGAAAPVQYLSPFQPQTQFIQIRPGAPGTAAAAAQPQFFLNQPIYRILPQ